MLVYWELDPDKFSSKFLPHGYGINISGLRKLAVYSNSGLVIIPILSIMDCGK